MALEDIATDHVQMILNNTHDKPKETKGKIMQVLNQILGAAIEDDIIAKNPAKSKRIKVTGKDTVTTPPYTCATDELSCRAHWERKKAQ
ncbi:MAG: hypothetical protein HFE94_05350 [Acutalibacter sp.]|nr:hypothetical protein [Acutalibacter sp.]